MLATVNRLRCLLRNADLVTNVERVMTDRKTFYLGGPGRSLTVRFPGQRRIGIY